jgi:hypothetical protein
MVLYTELCLAAAIPILLHFGSVTTLLNTTISDLIYQTAYAHTAHTTAHAGETEYR